MAQAIRAVRARVEMSPQAWGQSGAPMATVAIDGRGATGDPWPEPTIVSGGETAAPEAFAPTQVVDSRSPRDPQPGDQYGVQSDQPPSFDGTLVADARRGEDVTAAPKEPSYQTRTETPPPSHTWRYVAIAACVIVIPAAVYGLITYLASTDTGSAPPPIATSGGGRSEPAAGGVGTSGGSNGGGLTNGGDIGPRPRPDDPAAGSVDAGKDNAATTGTATGGGAAPTRTDVDAVTKGGTTLPADGGIKPDGTDAGPVRTAYELFNASSGPTMPGVIYRVLQRTNGGDSVISVDPRDTVFRTGRDQFRFAFRSNMDGYLYVAQRNDQGDWDVVFPEPGVNGGSNRVLKNRDYIAPSPDWFQLDPPSGTDQVFVFLSKTPVSAFTDLNRPVTSEATLAQADIEKLKSTISMRKLVVAKGDVPAAAAGTGGSGVYVVNADSFANAVMVTFDMTHK
jgi:hypothetical protein